MLSDDWVTRSLQQLRREPLTFATQILKLQPEDWQAQALIAAGRESRISIRSGHSVGKTTLLAILVLHQQLTAFPALTLTTAPTEKHLKEVLWKQIEVWLKRLPQDCQDWFKLTDQKLELKIDPANSFALGAVATKEKPEAFAGYHSENILMIADEASGLPEETFEAAMSALATPGARMILAGNPVRPSGFFYETHHKLRERWWTQRVNSENVPRARGHIEDVIAVYGRDSNAYRVRVLGEFPSTADEQVIPLDLVEAAIARDIDPSTAFRPVWGVDVARFGDDRSALCKRRGNRLLGPIEAWRNLDTMQTAGRVKAQYDSLEAEERPSEILVDVIGIGAGVVDRLNEMGLPARGVNVGESPSVSGRFMRLRDELWWKTREWFSQRDCSIPDDKALVAELIGPTYDIPSNGKLVVESKDDMKKRLGQSPDLADALVLTMAGGNDRDYMAEEKKDRYSRRRHGNNAGRSWMSSI